MNKFSSNSKDSKSEKNNQVKPDLDFLQDSFFTINNRFFLDERRYKGIIYVLILLLVISIIGNVIQGSVPSKIPYVIEVRDNKNYSSHILSESDMNFERNSTIVTSTLRELIIRPLRTISVDDNVMFDNFNRVLTTYILAGESADIYIRNQYENSKNFQNGLLRRISLFETSTFITDNENVLLVPSDFVHNVRISWKEEVYDIQGKVISETVYVGIISFKILVPKTDYDILNNPLGIYLVDISFNPTKEG